ncbi:hypothetical protein BCR36DRAFT_580900 [Piromyces finnis]|uniref:SET domain-containing protein n=1 Tax=Piromyces finnis TaxID=1754191 RepID=A0A1Y1VHY5_9FUNG|nr:hypothetical protein BCR36DRAFT_580900 [Piromyces finnis]|eukprot:ORX56584.1 hypothetical protein BCR36DRAFT_580900 [Piromyces finnis]
MARGVSRALKSKAENKKDKKEKRDQLKKDKEENSDKPNEVPKFFKYEDGKRSPFATFCIKAGSIFLLLFVWSNLFVQKYVPYKQQNEVLTRVLQDPELIKHTVKISHEYQEMYNKYMEENDNEARIKLFEKITESDIFKGNSEVENIVPVDDEEVPNSETKKEIPPEEEDDVDVIGDMREEIMGGEIYTVDEIFKKLGIERISDYDIEGEYERNLLKEFRMDREMPENIAKKADFFKPIIERGLKEDERFFVKKINDKKGYGLFANVDIVPNEVLGIYTGVIRATDAEKGKKYEWYYSTIPDYKLEKMVELRVNGKSKGSHLRFVNHSLYYNARIEYVPYNNQWAILFISNRYINRGEEVTVNYREKTKRMPSKIIDKWDKVEEEEMQKLYDEYMKLKAQQEAEQQQVNSEANAEENKAPTKEEL